MTRIALAALVSIAAMLTFVSPAAAQDGDIVIVTAGILTGQAEGSIVEVASQAVPANLQGSTCTITGSTENNGSVHPGNNLIIATGATTVTVPGVEEVPGQVVAGSGPIVLGSTVAVSVEFGASGSTSGGVTLVFDCAAVAPGGGVATGAGGTADDPGRSILPLALGAAALAGAGIFVGRKRLTAFGS